MKVLPGYPKSGLPKDFVDRRGSFFTTFISAALWLLVIYFLYFWSRAVLLGMFNFKKGPSLLMNFEVSVVFLQ